jgi:transposase
MKLHRHARTCPNNRRLIVARVTRQGWLVTATAEAAGISERTVDRWVKRWRQEGAQGLSDCSSRPRHSPTRLSAGKIRRSMPCVGCA